MNGITEPGSSVGKFQVIKGYLPVSPSKCMGCGAYHGTFIDFGLNDDWYGAVYFCYDCVRGMATEFGFVSGDEKVKFVTKIEEYVEKIKELEKEKEKYKNALAALDSFMSSTTVVNPDNGSDVEVIPDKGAEQPKSDSKSARREKRSSKQNDVEGSSSVSNDDGLDQFISI